MIPSSRSIPPLHKSQPGQFLKKHSRVLLDPAALLIVDFGQMIHHLLQAMGAVTHLPNQCTNLVDRNGQAGVLLKEQNSLIWKGVGIDFRAAEE